MRATFTWRGQSKVYKIYTFFLHPISNIPCTHAKYLLIPSVPDANNPSPCLQYTIIKMPSQLQEQKNKLGRVRAWQGWLLLLFWYPQWSLPTEGGLCRLQPQLLLNTLRSLSTEELGFVIKCICCDNFSDNKSRWMTGTQGLSCSGGWQNPLWQVLDTEKNLSSNFMNDRSIQELPLFLLTNAITNWF